MLVQTTAKTVEKVDISKILRFWRSLEASLHQKADKKDEGSKQNPVYAIDTSQPLMPWENRDHLEKEIGDKMAWQYTLQCGLYETKELAKSIEEKLGAHEDVLDERISHEKSRLFDLKFDEHGYPIADSFMLSLAGWSAGQLLNHGLEVLENGGQANLEDLPNPSAEIPDPRSGYGGFDTLVRALMQWLTDQEYTLRLEKTPATFSWLQGFTELVSQHCLLPEEIIKNGCLGKCYQVRRPPENEQKESVQEESEQKKVRIQSGGLLNSFFIQDLDTLLDAWDKKTFGDGFSRYMTAVAQEKSGQVDVRKKEGRDQACQQLHPSYMPAGKWPSDFPLAFSQQLAVNKIWADLHSSQGIFAVNGPPGTGKTTLLRDVVAAVVTQRAQDLVKLGKNAFREQGKVSFDDKTFSYKELAPALSGTAIIVASANNGAVENISLELPGITAIPESMRGNVGYFPKLATKVLGEDAWGLLAARLGRKKNRTEFMNKFWWPTPDDDKQKTGKKPRLGEAFEDPKEGLLNHLQLIRDKQRQPALSWEDAVEQFQKAQQAETACRTELEHAAQLPKSIADLETEIDKIGAETARLQEQIAEQGRKNDDVQEKLDTLSSQLKTAQAAEQAALNTLQFHVANKPGVLMWISTLGTSHRHWWFKRQDLEEDHTLQKQSVRQAQRVLKESQTQHNDAARVMKQLRKEIERKEAAQKELRNNLESQQTELADAQAKLGNNWPNPQTDDEADDAARELSTPWSTPEWHEAREQLFLAALAVHRAFIEANPTQIISNLRLVSNWLNGKDINETAARTALDSLCLVVPVLSTTFASLPRMLHAVGREAIGWLLIDEAGQALPQQAAGAIWRAKRTVVVGDPNQLEPVLAVPACLEGALAAHYNVPQTWWPSKTSVQRLADQTMQLGTWLPDGSDGESDIWVGCPLRVHRRCDEPMFSISNTIAYDGLMVYGKQKKADTAYPESHWIDVSSDKSEGHWIPEEGAAAENLIRDLIENHQIKPDDLFLISPFRSCANKLSAMTEDLKLNPQKTGTVHTTQGKEAEVVILVLGGNPQKSGAKDWAAEKPNLLNVAVSRAKSKLYVIGNRSAWQNLRNFSVLADKVNTRKNLAQ